jgi:hypothetical protein
MAMQKNWKFKAGIILIGLSAVFFGALLGVPFLDAGSRQKITISTVLVVLGEISFWSGGILLGKELFTKYKALMNPVNWFRKKDTPGNADNEPGKSL